MDFHKFSRPIDDQKLTVNCCPLGRPAAVVSRQLCQHCSPSPRSLSVGDLRVRLDIQFVLDYLNQVAIHLLLLVLLLFGWHLVDAVITLGVGVVRVIRIEPVKFALVDAQLRARLQRLRLPVCDWIWLGFIGLDLVGCGLGLDDDWLQGL
jgi:hypothetical protein